MPQIGGKSAKKTSSSTTSKRHFTVVMGNKEHGLYVSSSPSSAARKAVSKLCATDKKRKVEFQIREITRGSKKKTYGPYLGEIEKLEKPALFNLSVDPSEQYDIYGKNEKIVNEINELVRKHKAGVIPVKSNLED